MKLEEDYNYIIKELNKRRMAPCGFCTSYSCVPNPHECTKDDFVISKAVEALEKQIPKKPIEAKNIYPPEQFECPVCGGCVGRHKTVRKINDVWGETLTDCKVEYAYCLECGQKIDWSENNE